MEITRQFFLYLNKFVLITDEEFKNFIQPYLLIRKFGKREIVSRQGEVEDYLNFIVEGLARKYYLQDNDEVNTQISHEGHMHRNLFIAANLRNILLKHWNLPVLFLLRITTWKKYTSRMQSWSG
jgi:CRP-like cAMP-binding protein